MQSNLYKYSQIASDTLTRYETMNGVNRTREYIYIHISEIKRKKHFPHI